MKAAKLLISAEELSWRNPISACLSWLNECIDDLSLVEKTGGSTRPLTCECDSVLPLPPFVFPMKLCHTPLGNLIDGVEHDL